MTREIDRGTAPQLNRVREEYVAGELGDDDFEREVERSLAAGPPIGSTSHTRTPPTGVDAITSTVAGVFIAPLVWLVSRRSDTSNVSYDWTQHVVHSIDHDPGPDDHPAESAGAVQVLLKFWPVVFGLMLSYGAELHAPVLAVVFLAVTLACTRAPAPTVEVVDRGLGRHIVPGDHLEDDS